MKRRIFFKRLLLAGIITVIVFALIKNNFLPGFDRLFLASRYIFTEKSGHIFTLSEDEKSRLREYLSHYYFEDHGSAGFGINRQSQPDIFRRLYFNKRLAMLTGIDEDQEYQQMFGIVFDRFEGLINVWELPAYEHFYYYCLKNLLGRPVAEEDVLPVLESSTAAGSGLLFYRHPDDDISIKLLLTAKVMRLAKINNINLHDLGYEDAIRRKFSIYSLQNPGQGQTFFASGGSLFYAAGYIPGSNSEGDYYDAWFRSWLDIYANQNVHDLKSLIDHSSFRDVASIFGIDHSTKIVEYLSSLSQSDLADHWGNEQSSEVLHDYVFVPGNRIINKDIVKRTEEIVLNELREIKKEATSVELINIGDTYYGAELAYLCNFDWNTAKVLSTMQERYDAQSQLSSDREFIFNTYYYLLMLTSFDAERHSPLDASSLLTRLSPRSAAALPVRLDKIIGRLLTNIEQTDVTQLRVALEILSNLDIPISRLNMKRASDLVRQYARNPVHTVKAIDIYKIDYLINFNLLTQNQFDLLEKELADYGGYRSAAGEPADLVTTFRFYSMTSNHELFRPDEKKVRDLKIFLDTINSDGLYKYRPDQRLIDFRSMRYGFMLRDFPGGQKDD